MFYLNFIVLKKILYDGNNRCTLKEKNTEMDKNEKPLSSQAFLSRPIQSIGPTRVVLL